MSESVVNVRYMVSDVQEAADWYVGLMGFSRLPNASPAFAAVERGPLRLLLSGKASSAGRPMPDGRQPEPGGWTRFQIIVEDLAAEVGRLRGEGVTFRNDILTGPGGSQILAEDPSGNLVELFQPAVWG
ncbi:VOC family protein [Phenylobacterium ferrooxidans]|uniref:VOC family protein n=1 Tax=Phenylobacterium ferrooxidans TaxID=2982689 RepID=A0ABW6CTA0_9CAUL